MDQFTDEVARDTKERQFQFALDPGVTRGRIGRNPRVGLHRVSRRRRKSTFTAYNHVRRRLSRPLPGPVDTQMSYTGDQKTQSNARNGGHYKIVVPKSRSQSDNHRDRCASAASASASGKRIWPSCAGSPRGFRTSGHFCETQPQPARIRYLEYVSIPWTQWRASEINAQSWAWDGESKIDAHSDPGQP
jgi:hypothetical protein